MYFLTVLKPVFFTGLKSWCQQGWFLPEAALFQRLPTFLSCGCITQYPLLVPQGLLLFDLLAASF